jgi:hypothetical protein
MPWQPSCGILGRALALAEVEGFPTEAAIIRPYVFKTYSIIVTVSS